MSATRGLKRRWPKALSRAAKGLEKAAKCTGHCVRKWKKSARCHNVAGRATRASAVTGLLSVGAQRAAAAAAAAAVAAAAAAEEKAAAVEGVEAVERGAIAAAAAAAAAAVRVAQRLRNPWWVHRCRWRFPSWPLPLPLLRPLRT